MSARRTRWQLQEAALGPGSRTFSRQEDSTERDPHINLVSWQAQDGTASGKWDEINQFLCVEETNSSSQLRDAQAPELVSSLLWSPWTSCPGVLHVVTSDTTGVWCPEVTANGTPLFSAWPDRSICRADKHAHSHYFSLVQNAQECTRLQTLVHRALILMQRNMPGAMSHTGINSHPRPPCARCYISWERNKIKAFLQETPYVIKIPLENDNIRRFYSPNKS